MQMLQMCEGSWFIDHGSWSEGRVAVAVTGRFIANGS